MKYRLISLQIHPSSSPSFPSVWSLLFSSLSTCSSPFTVIILPHLIYTIGSSCLHCHHLWVGRQPTAWSQVILPECYVTFGSLLPQIRLSSETITFVRPTQEVETFDNISWPLCTLAITLPPCKILLRSSKRNPSVGSVKCKRGCKIERCHVRVSRLLMSFLLIKALIWMVANADFVPVCLHFHCCLDLSSSMLTASLVLPVTAAVIVHLCGWFATGLHWAIHISWSKWCLSVELSRV